VDRHEPGRKGFNDVLTAVTTDVKPRWPIAGCGVVPRSFAHQRSDLALKSTIDPEVLASALGDAAKSVRLPPPHRCSCRPK